MTNERKSSEERIREARSRLTSGADVPDAPEETTVEADWHEAIEVEAPPVEPVTPVEPVMPVTGEHAADPPSVPETVYEPSEPPTWAPDIPVETGPPPRRFFTTRWFRLVVLLAAGLGYGFFTSLDDAGRDDTGEIVTAGDLDVMAVQPGDCFDDPEATADDTVSALQALPCSEPHDNEVFAVESIAAVFGSEYPGRQALEEHAYDVCSGNVFDAYVGTEYFDSELEVFTLTPTDDSWSQGDRDVVCVLYKLDLTKLTHSARDSGL